MQSQRVAVSLAAINLPLRKAMRHAGEIGADGVQLEVGRHFGVADMTESARRQLLRELSDRGLGISSLTVPVNRALFDPDGLDERLEHIRNTMLLSFQLKADVITFRMGRIPTDESSAMYETLTGVMNDLARHANHVGAIPSVGFAGESSDAVSKLLGRITDGPCGVNFDPAGVILGGQSPSQVFCELLNHVNHMVIRDAVRDLDGAVLEVPLGRGEVPWDELFAVTVEAEFRGWMTVVRTQGNDKAGDVARAVKFIRNVLPG